jgi:ATP-dependent Clp protease ATP-binding subunit ClpA
LLGDTFKRKIISGQTLSNADAHVRKAINTALKRIGSTEHLVHGKQNPNWQQTERRSYSNFISCKLEKTLSCALDFAKERHHEYATLEHLCLALTKDRDVIAVLDACGVDLDKLRSELIEYLGNELSNLITNIPEKTKPIPDFNRVLEWAAIQIQSSGREEVTGANVLVALFSERESHAVYLLQKQEMTRYDAVNYICHGIAKNFGRLKKYLKSKK